LPTTSPVWRGGKGKRGGRERDRERGTERERERGTETERETLETMMGIAAKDEVQFGSRSWYY